MKVGLFHLGPPKTATTWVYYCLREHPQIATSKLDRIHYFDMHYARGDEWYNAQFPAGAAQGGKTLFDPTYSYICSPRAPERIAQYNPQARMMLCLRNPIDRAFSHYWHIKKMPGNDGLKFSDVLDHYNSYATWLEHGFVGIGLRRLLDFFPRESLYIMMFDDLESQPAAEFKKICDFSGIDAGFTPPSLEKKINVAGAKRTLAGRGKNALYRLIGGGAGGKTHNPMLRKLSGKEEYLRGMEPEMRARLMEICEPEIVEIERLTGIDLSEWWHEPENVSTGKAA